MWLSPENTVATRTSQAIPFYVYFANLASFVAFCVIAASSILGSFILLADIPATHFESILFLKGAI